MKKLISILCILTLVIGVAAVSAVSANADEVSKGSTALDVKSGDEVSYALFLENVEQPIIGSDFSVYYDSSAFELVSVADYNNSTNEDDWEATINPDLDGQVRGVWSILKGVDFSSKRNFLTVNLKAKSDVNDTHITYRIRYLYDNNVFNSSDYPQIDQYLFTCNVTVNGQEVLQDAAPEVNVDKEAENGKFVQSYDGDSDHADANIPGVVDKSKANSGDGEVNNNDNVAADNGGAAVDNNGGAAANNNSGGAAGNVSGGNNAANNNSAGSKAESNETAAPPATTAEGYYITATDAQGKVTATSDEAPVTATGSSDKGGSPVLWIIIVLVVLAGGGAAAYFYMKKKPSDGSAESQTSAEGEKKAPAESEDKPGEN